MPNQENAIVINKDYANNYQANAPENTIVLDKDFSVVDLQQFQDHKRRINGILSTIESQSYFDYVKSRQAEQSKFKSRTFVNANSPESFLQAVTVLNFGDATGVDTAGRGDDRAELNLSKDPMFEDFLETFNNEQFKTTKLAETLEGYLGTIEIEARRENQTASLASAIQAFRNLKVQASQESTVQSTQYKSEQSDMEQFEAQAVGGELPEYLAVTTPIYIGLEKQTVLFKVKMHQRKENDKPVAYFELVPIALKFAYLQSGINFQNLIRANLPDEEVTIGTWKA